LIKKGKQSFKKILKKIFSGEKIFGKINPSVMALERQPWLWRDIWINYPTKRCNLGLNKI
jgi:hypothetical protein